MWARSGLTAMSRRRQAHRERERAREGELGMMLRQEGAETEGTGQNTEFISSL